MGEGVSTRSQRLGLHRVAREGESGKVKRRECEDCRVVAAMRTPISRTRQRAPRAARPFHFLIVMGGPLGFAGGGALVTLSLAPPILFHVPVPSLPVATTTPGDCTL